MYREIDADLGGVDQKINIEKVEFPQKRLDPEHIVNCFRCIVKNCTHGDFAETAICFRYHIYEFLTMIDGQVTIYVYACEVSHTVLASEPLNEFAMPWKYFSINDIPFPTASDS